MSTKAQTAMSSSFGGDLEQFALTPSSADVISAPLRTSTHSEVLGKRTTPIAFAFFFCDGLQPEVGFLHSWAAVLLKFSYMSSLFGGAKVY